MESFKIGDNTVTANSGISLGNSEITTDDVSIIYELGGNAKSWKPGSELNSLTKLTKGKEYLIKAKRDFTITKF